MDAYSSYIIQTTNAQRADRRRQEAEYALSRAIRARRGSWWSRVLIRLRPRPVAAVEPVTPVTLPAAAAGDEPLRRTA